MKAKQTGFKMYSKYYTDVEYEYRGRKYFVTFANDMNCLVTSPKVQHELEQEKIDKALDTPPKATSEPFDIDEIFEILEWD